MSRDGEIVYEIVTTKYKIAELNRQRKFRFLCGEPINKKGLTRSGSTPVIPKMEDTEYKKPLDLSVPGTPVSSRYISFMRKKGNFIEDSEDEDQEESEKPKMARMVDDKVLNESLKKFLADMNSLESSEPKNAKIPEKPFEEYFKKSDEKKSYSSSFEVAESEIVIGAPTAPVAEKIKNPKIEKYFEDSARRNSFQRDFTEVYQEVKKKDQFTDLSVPGTPISSRYGL